MAYGGTAIQFPADIHGGTKVQTFMPNHDYQVTALQLDDKRLGKQRVEAYQILNALLGRSNGWIHHPATKMWQGHEYQLAQYGWVICYEWFSRGFQDSLLWKFDEALTELDKTKKPWWVNNQLLNLTHQSNLVRKDSALYEYQVPSNIPYVWPFADEEAFRLGTFKNGDNLDMLKNGVVYLTSTQVAELLGVSPKTISAYKSRGQMPPPDKEYGRTPLWSYSTIEKWRGELRPPVIPK